MSESYTGDIKSSLRQLPRVNYSESQKRTMSDTPVDMNIQRTVGDGPNNSAVPTEEEMRALKEKLDAAKAKQAEDARKAEYAAMVKELRDIEDGAQAAITDTSKKGRRKKKQLESDVTTKTLRESEEVQQKVDQMLRGTAGNEFGHNGDDSCSSDSDSDSSSSSADSSSSSSSDERSSRRRRSKKTKKSTKENQRNRRKRKRVGRIVSHLLRSFFLKNGPITISGNTWPHPRSVTNNLLWGNFARDMRQ